MVVGRALLLLLMLVILMTSHTEDHTSPAMALAQEDFEDDSSDMPPVAPMIPTGCNSALSVMEQDERFSIFANAVKETGLDSVLGSIRLIATVFLPDNEAIKRTFSEIRGLQTSEGESMSPEFLLRDYEALYAIVKMHIVPMYNLYTDSLQSYGDQCYETMVPGQCLQVTVQNDTVIFPGRKDMAIEIIEPLKDMASGCPTLMHGINGLLIPPEL